MTPTRGRPRRVKDMMMSALNTAEHQDEIEFIFWLDEDDPELSENLGTIYFYPGGKHLVGPRNIIHSARWDKCLALAEGDLLFHANDDILFRTPGWDVMIEEFFAASEDKLWVVGGDDAYLRSETLMPHPIVHRRWVETLGYFIPPYFDGEWGDTWVSDLAARVGRKKFLPFVCEHMHYSRNENFFCPKCGRNNCIASVEQGSFCNACGHLWGASRMDETTRTYMARSQSQNPGQIYEEREAERIRDAGKLKALLGTPYQT